ncbi:MAG TPA: lipopolysaccharide assembly protein LapA domain-containing protein [Dongiaceae bacterium]|jgi:uncharacterized integral membrane protein|nr:lipopolysaccharide assembly protein LapA domain-containing protein [Dongiaceae bacterium]
MRVIVRLLALLFSVCFLLFALDNRAWTSLSFWPFPWNVSLPLYLLVILAGLFGLIIGIVSGYWQGRIRRRDLQRLRQENQALRQELARRTEASQAGSAEKSRT